MTQFMRRGAYLVYLFVVEFTLPLCQHVMFSWTLAKKIATIIIRVWVKKIIRKLPEQMLYYTTLVYLCPLRGVHQTTDTLYL